MAAVEGGAGGAVPVLLGWGAGQGWVEALAMEARVAGVAKEYVVGIGPSGDAANLAGGVVVAAFLCCLGVTGGVFGQPVVATTEAGKGVAVIWGDGGVG